MSGRPQGHREEAQARHRNAEQMRVGMRHQFVRRFGRGIKRQRLIDALVFGKRRHRVAAVHR